MHPADLSAHVLRSLVERAAVDPAEVVTEESRSRDTDKPRIPDACDAQGIRWPALMGYVEEQGWTF